MLLRTKRFYRNHGKCLWDTNSLNNSKSTVKISEGGTDFEIELCTIAKSSFIPVWRQMIYKSPQTCLNLIPGWPWQSLMGVALNASWRLSKLTGFYRGWGLDPLRRAALLSNSNRSMRLQCEISTDVCSAAFCCLTEAPVNSESCFTIHQLNSIRRRAGEKKIQLQWKYTHCKRHFYHICILLCASVTHACKILSDNKMKYI